MDESTRTAVAGRGPSRRARVMLGAAWLACTPFVVPSASGASVPLDPDAAAVVEWNAIASRTVLAEAKVPPPAAQLYLGITAVAVYDAVVSIEGYYEPYLQHHAAPDGASTRAAVATAASTVLGTYFPASSAMLAADRERTLAGIDPAAADLGVDVGERAAAAVLAARADDGRNADVRLEVVPGPGAWDDSVAPMVAPWLGFVTPLVLDEPDEIALPGPVPLTSEAYAADFEEVRTMGAATGSARTPDQTEVARFWSDNPVRQYQDALRDLVTDHGHDAADAARTLGIANTALADGIVACWNAKFAERYWRPSTAIRAGDTDGNDATVGDPTWTPLLANPAYPDYPSGHACLTGALTEVLGSLYGSWDIDLTVASLVTGTSRTFASAGELDADAGNGRIWLGIHFRTAMRDGNLLGHEVGEAVMDRAFNPLDGDACD